MALLQQGDELAAVFVGPADFSTPGSRSRVGGHRKTVFRTEEPARIQAEDWFGSLFSRQGSGDFRVDPAGQPGPVRPGWRQTGSAIRKTAGMTQGEAAWTLRYIQAG